MPLLVLALVIVFFGCTSPSPCAPAHTGVGQFIQAVAQEAFNKCPNIEDGPGAEPDALGARDAGVTTGCADSPTDPCSQCIASCSLTNGDNCTGTPSSATISCSAEKCSASCQGT